MRLILQPFSVECHIVVIRLGSYSLFLLVWFMMALLLFVSFNLPTWWSCQTQAWWRARSKLDISAGIFHCHVQRACLSQKPLAGLLPACEIKSRAKTHFFWTLGPQEFPNTDTGPYCYCLSCQKRTNKQWCFSMLSKKFINHKYLHKDKDN